MLRTTSPRHSRKRPGEHGFSLVEILVVIVILGILATIVVFALRGARDDAASAAAARDANVLATAEEAYQAQHGRYATEQELVDGGFIHSLSALHDIALEADGNYRLVDTAPSDGSPAGADAAPATSVSGGTVTSVVPSTTTGSSTSTPAPGTTAVSTSTTATTSPPATTTLPATTTTAAPTPAAPAAMAGVTCSFIVESAWGSGGNGTLRITNQSGTALATWTVYIERAGYGLSLWNATTVASDSSSLTAKNLGWNGDVPNGATAAPTGGGVSGSNVTTGLSLPCTVLANPVTAANVSCQFTLYQAWDGGGNGTLTITNDNGVALSSWTVVIKRQGRTISLWSANSSTSGGDVIASNQSHNASVGAGASSQVTGGSVSGNSLSNGMSFPCSVSAAS